MLQGDSANHSTTVLPMSRLEPHMILKQHRLCLIHQQFTIIIIHSNQIHNNTYMLLMKGYLIYSVYKIKMFQENSEFFLRIVEDWFIDKHVIPQQ